MKIFIDENLKELANIFSENGTKLFVVGGYVRNSLLKIETSDIDICSSVPPNMVSEILINSNFKTKLINRKLGTLLIYNDECSYEHTTFRKENYALGGSHNPLEVFFVDCIKTDSARRDFTINSIYYDIKNDKILDFYKGKTDLKKHLIKAIKTPQEVFSSDGLRLLRLIRFAISFGFLIDLKTLIYAKIYSFQLKDISKERILAEIKQIVIADKKYNFKKTFFWNLFVLLNKINLVKYIFNNNLKKLKTYKISRFYNLKSDYRYIAFCMIVLDNYFNRKIMTYEHILYGTHLLFGKDGLKDTNESIHEIICTYYIYQLKNNYSKSLNPYVISYYSLPDKLKDFLKAFSPVIYKKLNDLIEVKKQKNTPLSISELKITNNDLLRLKIKNSNINIIKQKLFDCCYNEKLKNEKLELLDLAIIINKNMVNKDD